MTNVIKIGDFKKRQKEGPGAEAAPAKSTDSPPAPTLNIPADPIRSMVRAAAGETWAGKFRLELADGSTREGLDDASMLAASAFMGTLDVQKVLNRLVRRDERQIRAYKEVVEGYSAEDLHGWLMDPKDRDLQKKPYFFHALIDEAKRRFLASPTPPDGNSPG